MSVDALMSMNPGVSAERLQIGQTINVPCSGEFQTVSLPDRAVVRGTLLA